ncbi:MAG: hypothetical protein LBJ36_01205 [Synergistaceae bacterium]|nr:hypothetical protein [Synergistaceae bacterium]
MNNSRAFVFNTIAGIAMVMVSTTNSFIVPKLTLGVYGMEITGLVASITQLMAFFMLIEAGLSKAVTVNLYAPMANKDYKAASGILVASKRLYDKISVFFATLVLGVAFIYPLIVRNSNVGYSTTFLLFIILGANGLLEFVAIKRYSVVLTADNRVGVIQIAHTVRLALQCGLVSVLIYFRLPILIVEAASIIIYIICPIILHLYCRKMYSRIDYSAPPNTEALANHYDAMVQPLTLVTQTSAPIVIATILLPISEVGILSMYLIVVRGVDNILGVLSSTTSAFGQLYAQGESERLYRAYGQFESLVCFLSAIVFSVMTVNFEPFMRLYSGSTVSGLAFLCCVRGFTRNLRMPQDNMLNAIGWFRGTRRYMITQTLIQITASVLLGLKFGVLGIFIGDILSQVYRDLEIVIHIPKKVGFRILPSISRWLVSVTCFSLIGFLLGRTNFLFPRIGSFGAWIEFSAFSLVLSTLIAGAAFMALDRRIYAKIFKVKVMPFARRLAGKLK